MSSANAELLQPLEGMVCFLLVTSTLLLGAFLFVLREARMIRLELAEFRDACTAFEDTGRSAFVTIFGIKRGVDTLLLATGRMGTNEI